MKMILSFLFALLITCSIYAQADRTYLPKNIPQDPEGHKVSVLYYFDATDSSFHPFDLKNDTLNSTIIDTLTAMFTSRDPTLTQDTLTLGDSIKYYNPNGLYEYVQVGIRDTGDTFTDTLSIYYTVNTDTAGATWYLLGGFNQYDKTFTSGDAYIPGDGENRAYILFDFRIYWIKIIRTNVNDVNRPTYLEIIEK